jgi:REP element-mobilizing transposase RayT
VVIRLYQGAVTKRARVEGLASSVWQRGYYEHIVRDDEEFSRLAEYIADNPIGWDEDPENPMRGPR